MKSRLLLLALGSVAGLVGGEVAARALRLSKTWTSYHTDFAQNFRHYITSEPVGFRRKPSLTFPMPLGKRFSANSLGFREREFPKNKKPGTTRIVVLGDSVAEGYGVEIHERFSSGMALSLEHSKPGRFEVLNFAVIGHATADEYVVLRDHALAYAPDIVVLQFGWNDLGINSCKLPLIEAGSGTPSSATVAAAADCVSTWNQQVSPSTSFKTIFQKHSALYLTIAERWSLLRIRRGGTNRVLENALTSTTEDWRATEKILERVVAALAGRAILLVAYLPLDAEVQTPFEELGGAIDHRLRSLAPLSGPNVIVVDVLDPLRQHRSEDLYLDDVHPTAHGHRIVGAEIARTISQSLETVAPVQAQVTSPMGPVARGGSRPRP